MKTDPKENRYRRLAISVVSRCLASILALSFLATLLPAGTAAAKSIMACCKGKATGHCHATLKSKKSSASISNPCHTDCCSSSTAAQHQKRERGTAPPIGSYIARPAVVWQSASVTSLVSSSDEWPQINPRGPPTFLL